MRAIDRLPVTVSVEGVPKTGRIDLSERGKILKGPEGQQGHVQILL